MALTILPPGRQKQTTGQKLGQAIGAGLESAQKIYEGYQEKEKSAQENQAIKKQTGLDLSGITDPKTRQAIIAEALKGQRKKAELEEFRKTFGVESQPQDESQVADENIPWYERSTKEEQPWQMQEFGEEPRLKKQSSTQSKLDFANLSDEKIAEMTLTNKSLGDAARAAKNAAFKRDIEQQKLEERKKTREESGIERSYQSQKDFIDDTTKSYKGFETDMKPRLLQMRNIPDEDIIGPTAATFLDHLGIPLGALENPSSELYNKLSQDLLKGLPETYGSRILKVEVDNFLKTIPTLMNSPDGRRMIASNMLKLGEMKEVYYNAMRREQKKIEEKKEQYPRDFQQTVFDQVKPQVDRINEEFVKLSEITSVPKNHIPFFGPNGQIEFVPKEHAQWAQENGGRRIW
jgi:hypothetical protein